jgi:hypothetical protein
MTRSPRLSRIAAARVLRAERQRQRIRAGPLRDRRIKAVTLGRYRRHLRWWIRWCRATGHGLPRTRLALDLACSAYAECLYQEGESKSVLANTLSAVVHYVPSLKGSLRAAWGLYAVWHREEPEAQCPAIDVATLQAMAGAMVYRGYPRAALATLLAHHCCLRTVEMLTLATTDILLGSQRSLLILRSTKIGQRMGVDEEVTVHDAFVLRGLRRLVPSLQRGATLLGMSGFEYRKLWKLVVADLRLPRDVQPYGLRRGGATCLFQHSGSFDAVAVRGRWHTLKALRVYIKGALLEWAVAEVSPQDRQLRLRFAQVLHLLVGTR